MLKFSKVIKFFSPSKMAGGKMKKVLCVFCLMVILGGYGFSQNNMRLSLNKSDYDRNEKIIVTFQGITQEMISAKAWIGISPVDAPPNNYLNWQYVTQNSGQIELVAPNTSGSFEIRLFRTSSATVDSYLQNETMKFSVQ